MVWEPVPPRPESLVYADGCHGILLRSDGLIKLGFYNEEPNFENNITVKTRTAMLVMPLAGFLELCRECDSSLKKLRDAGVLPTEE
jgi:hypothetical protein